MNNLTKLPILFALIAVWISGVTACRQTEVAESENPSRTTDQEPPTFTPPPFAWNEVSKNYDDLTDYAAVYEKEEKVISKGEKQTIKFSFRKPFDVRMDWLDDKGRINQTAVYQRGKNDDLVLAKESGLLGLLAGVVKFKPTSEIARQDSKHPINEAGLGMLIKRIIAETANPLTTTNYQGEETVANRRIVYKIEVKNRTGINLTGTTDTYRAVILIDKILLLPVQIETYDKNNGLLERHAFKDLKVNVKLTDKTFELERE